MAKQIHNGGKQKAVKAVRVQDKVFKTIPFDLSNKIEVIIDHRTKIYIDKGQDIEKARQNFLKKQKTKRF